MAQKTALQFLIEQLKGYEYDGNDFIFTGIMSSELIEQAKQMEKEQIVYAHLTGLIHPLEIDATKQAEQYYNETYAQQQ